MTIFACPLELPRPHPKAGPEVLPHWLWEGGIRKIPACLKIGQRWRGEGREGSCALFSTQMEGCAWGLRGCPSGRVGCTPGLLPALYLDPRLWGANALGENGPSLVHTSAGWVLPLEVALARPADRARLMLMKTVQTTASMERMRAH